MIHFWKLFHIPSVSHISSQVLYTLSIEQILKYSRFSLFCTEIYYKVCPNAKVRNDTVGIRENFIQNVQHKIEHNDLFDYWAERFLVSRISVVVTIPSPSQHPWAHRLSSRAALLDIFSRGQIHGNHRATCPDCRVNGKLLPLKLGPFYVYDVWPCVIMKQNHTLREQLLHFILDGPV